MSGPINKSGETQPSENINQSTGGESENASEPSDTIERVAPDLTLVLIGDPASIEIGPKNIFLDHDEQTNEELFSSNLYNLCGRHICVINMLGLQTKEIPLNQGVHAFVLLLPNTLHSSQYSSAVQWLAKVFGRGALSYLITVVTREPGETCESALKELKTNTDFNEKRYHTCNRSMMDEKEVVDLLEKINVMVSENDSQRYSGLMCAENKEQEGHPEEKSHEEEGKDFKTNERGICLSVCLSVFLRLRHFSNTEAILKTNSHTQHKNKLNCESLILLCIMNLVTYFSTVTSELALVIFYHTTFIYKSF